MSKTALQFRHNGRDVAIFVDGGTNLLVALRESIGDMTPKFGCGQGGCGACSVLIDGELHLACLTLAETAAGRSRKGPICIRCSAPLPTILPPNAVTVHPAC
jgi:carbon-monoxide dehydrogenase small subunit